MSVLSDLIGLIDDAVTRVGTEFKTYRTFLTGSGTGAFSGLATTSTDVTGAINELHSAIVSGSGAHALDDLTDVTITSLATGKILRYNSGTTQWEVVDPTVYLQPRDAELDVWAGITLDIDGGLAANSDTRVASQKATKAYVDALINAANATVYKGTIDASTNPNYPAADSGHLYRISVAGRIGGAAGPRVEVGDMVLCFVDASAAGNHATVGANWDIVQGNLDGAVIGPAAATDGALAYFDGTSGKLIKDSGLILGTLGAWNPTTTFTNALT